MPNQKEVPETADFMSGKKFDAFHESFDEQELAGEETESKI